MSTEVLSGIRIQLQPFLEKTSLRRYRLVGDKLNSWPQVLQGYNTDLQLPCLCLLMTRSIEQQHGCWLVPEKIEFTNIIAILIIIIIIVIIIVNIVIIIIVIIDIVTVIVIITTASINIVIIVIFIFIVPLYAS